VLQFVLQVQSTLNAITDYKISVVLGYGAAKLVELEGLNIYK